MIVEMQPSKEVANSGGMRGGVGIEDDGIIETHTDMGDTVLDAFPEVLERARGACRAHRNTGPLEGARRSAECGELDGRRM